MRSYPQQKKSYGPLSEIIHELASSLILSRPLRHHNLNVQFFSGLFWAFPIRGHHNKQKTLVL